MSLGLCVRFGSLWLVGLVGCSLLNGQQSCSISGRVTEVGGAPVPFAVLQALRGDFVANGAVASREGEFCIPKLPPGEYRLRTVARAQPPTASPSCDSCCDPGKEFERAVAIPVQVTGSTAPTKIDVVLRRVPAFCVRGEVRDRTGALRPDYAIGLEMDGSSTGVLSEGGRFLLTNLPMGSYTVAIFDKPQMGSVVMRKVVQVEKANINRLVITLP
jgi:hypothetical protein